jgi:hypothetical protein
MADLFVVNAFSDLKIKSSGGGGFSDGGVINRSVALQESDEARVTVEIAPPPGVSYGPALFTSEGALGDAGPLVVNFSTLPVQVEEYFVSADGTETLLNQAVVNAGEIGTTTLFFAASGILQYPNKLRYRLASTKLPAPSDRVLLKYTLVEYDRPADQI